MKVLQLIDSLEAGGAERMAVNLANALSVKIEASFLCATRKEGLLKKSVSDDVEYVFLNKKNVIDFKAIKRLNSFVKRNKIEIIHAHSTSFFLATLIKFINHKLIIIWHDHYGNSEKLNERKFKVIRFCSNYFSHVFSVNKALEDWAFRRLKTKNISYLSNFPIKDLSQPDTQLQGESGYRILHLANLRPQKDHINLLKAFKSVNEIYSDWTLHLVGKDFNDDYSLLIKKFIKDRDLENHVFIYGSCSDVSHILSKCSIGVLSSKSEGLPLSLLEYGLSKLPAIVTNVGDCDKVISNSNEGQLVEPENPKAIKNAIIKFIEDIDLREAVAENLYLKVRKSFSESSNLDTLIEIYKQYNK